MAQARVSLETRELLDRVHWIIKLRWIAVAGMIGTIELVRRVSGVVLRTDMLYLIVSGVALYNLVFGMVGGSLKRRGQETFGQWVELFANLQIVSDLIALTLLVHFTGGVENPFSIYFIFHVIISSILLPARLALFHAALAVVLFWGVAIAEFFGFLPHVHVRGFLPVELYQNSLYLVAVVAAFVTTIGFSVYMATSITGQLRAKQQEVIELGEELAQNASRLQAALQKATRAEQGKSLYLRKVSHELRSPLAAVEGMLDLILEGYAGAVPDKAAELIQRARSRTQSLTKMINDLLVLSRTSDGRLPEQLKLIAVQDVAERVVNLLRVRAHQQNVALETDLPRDLPSVLGDSESIEQMITNLVSNAIKYTPAGGRVRLSARSEGGELIVEVSDSGIGIADHDLPHVFEEFYRGSNARNFASEGTGLGLSIVKSIVDMHNAKISVRSKLGEGSTFEVRFKVPPAG